MAAIPVTAQAAEATPPAGTSVGDGLFSRPDGIEARQGRVVMRVTALTDQILRVRIARDGVLPEDASWAVLPAMRAQHAPVKP
ncbi:MAG: alpha-glucosidase, partial [Sphingomonadales bacterium]|nr:alpha-glucosidase [Sphingomonadales bacterium]